MDILTINIDPELKRQLRISAAVENKNMSEMAIKIISDRIEEDKKKRGDLK